MAFLAALRMALSLADGKSSFRRSLCAPLPDGVAHLLRLAIADAEALRAAQTLTGRSRSALQKAAGMFVEEVMFCEGADSYRILGVAPTAGRGELRRNMTLLMKWLHPDSGGADALSSPHARDMLVQRLSRAWDTVKTQERRAAYDQSLREARREPGFYAKALHRRREKRRERRQSDTQSQHRASSRRLVVYRFEQGTLWSRLMTYLWMRI